MIRLKRRKRERTRPPRTDRVRCPGHLQWVRGHECAVAGLADAFNRCVGRIETHHVKTRGAGGGDDQVIPLCTRHHGQLDSPGWSARRFEEYFGIDMKKIAADLWQYSPRGQAYRRAERERKAS